jgi:hypothetical protein
MSLNEGEMKATTMTWAKRIFLTIPFAVASVLTILVALSDRLHLRLQRIAGYGFLFATPWGWLLDRLWTPTFHNRWMERMMGYVVILWIPALLYSLSLWIVMRVFRFPVSRTSR